MMYDAIVIGSGQGGTPLALSLAGAGRRTALIERRYVGGTCVNVGCTPTKTMVASARVAYLARRAAEYGVSAEVRGVDMIEVRRRKQSVVESFRNAGQRRLEQTPGLDLLFGEARFEGPHAVRVDLNAGGSLRLSAPWIVINTGCRPAPAGVAGVEGVPVLDSSSIMELDETPEHLLIMGGGYVGVEFGQMFRRFGSRVTIVQRGRQLLAQEDPDVAAEVVSILREDGIEVLLETKAEGVSKGMGGEREGGTRGRIRLSVKGAEGERTLEGSHLLAAAGRIPSTERLGLDAAGVRTDERGFIPVDEKLETSAPGIYAIGDVNGGPAFTHVSYDDFRILKANLIQKTSATTRGRLVPYTVFMDPQLGRVGLSEAQARALGLSVRVARLPMTRVARAIEMGEIRGFMKAVVGSENGEILGYAALGVEGGELMSMMEIAMMGKVPYTALRDAVFAHPTLAESLNNLFATLDG